MAERKATTTKIGGGADYAKVAERLKIFREENPRGKHESAFEFDVDGTIVFTVWLWKDKTELIELLKAGVTDKDALRSSADANGNARSKTVIVQSANTNSKAGEKEFEKLESIALGRALANLGYLASGEIASSEEMEEFEKFRAEQLAKEAEEFIEKIGSTVDNLALNKLLASSPNMLKNRLVIVAAKERQAKFAKETKDGTTN